MKIFWIAFSLVLFGPLLHSPLALGEALMGEGTGHQRVVEILGRPVPDSKIYINERQLPLRTRVLNVKDVQVIILNSDEVVKMNEIEKINYVHTPTSFENLKSIKLKEKGMVDKEDIFALITK